MKFFEKYYNEDIQSAFKEIEEVAANNLLTMLPEDIRSEYQNLFFPEPQDEYLWKLVKAGDKISALLKCVEEEKAGNTEFVNAKKATLEAIQKMQLEEVDVFFEEFYPAYEKTLDEL